MRSTAANISGRKKINLQKKSCAKILYLTVRKKQQYWNNRLHSLLCQIAFKAYFLNGALKPQCSGLRRIKKKDLERLKVGNSAAFVSVSCFSHISKVCVKSRNFIFH